jgi:hypothetical protein
MKDVSNSIRLAYPFMHNIDEEPEPDMSQVTEEMPSMDEYKRWEEAFTTYLGFTTAEFNFKLMRFIGASRNMIDDLKTMLENPDTLKRWNEFVKNQNDHRLILEALTVVACGIPKSVNPKPKQKPQQKKRGGRKKKVKAKAKTFTNRGRSARRKTRVIR